MYRLLIVEDDKTIAKSVAELSLRWGIEARICDDFMSVTSVFASYEPHIVLLDIGLPFCNGYHWCSEIRKLSDVPIIFISSASDSMNIVMAMNMGADDFIAKPFDADVLIAKVRSILRRCYDYKSPAEIMSAHGAFLNTADNSLIYNDEKIDLTKNEYRILFCLFESKGKVVSREKLMEKLWEGDSFVDENTLTVNVNRLRKKLAEKGLDELITTKFGVGYMIAD